MTYQKFSIQDFIEDAYFRKWVYQPDEVSNQFWKSWLVKYPEKKAEVDDARSILLSVQFKSYSVSDQEKREVWKQLLHQRENANPAANHSIPKRKSSLPNRLRWVSGIAASLAIVLLTYVWWMRSEEMVYTAEYGTTRTILLADQSTVELNANSTLRISHHWGERREVWLEGEAFFDIYHQEDESGQRIPFIVHTNELAVRVVGTEFNVLSRRGETQVGLHSGKVELTVATDEPSIDMQPGDWVAFSENDQQLIRDQLASTIYTAWRNQKFWFDNHTLSEIARMIEDYYGLGVTLSSPAVGQRTFSGQFPADRLNLMLEAIQATLKVSIVKTGNEIIISGEKE